MTHEDQRRVQILLVFLEEFLVVFLRDLMVLLVELGLISFLDGRCALVPAARGSDQNLGQMRTKPTWLAAFERSVPRPLLAPLPLRGSGCR